MKAYNYIYKITNQINGKIYIGKHSTDNLNDGYMGSGILIRKAEKKYGKENFTKEYLAFCDTEEKLNWFEKFYIKKYKARENGYNLTDGGDGSLGRYQSEETKMKISNTKSGVKVPKLSIALKGKPSGFKDKHHTEEAKRKISEGLKDKHRTEETKRKISEGHKGKSKPKYKWLKPTGEIKNMAPHIVSRYHKDWKLIEQV